MKKFRRTCTLLLALFLIAALALAGCGGGSATTPSGDAGAGSQTGQAPSTPQVAIYATGDEPVVNWDPADGASNEIIVLNEIYETLLRYDPTSQSFEPVLATEWSSADEARTWTFKLRQGVKFHSGNEMTSEDVKVSVERCIQRGMGVCYIFDPVETIETPDPYTVVFKLKYPAGMDMIMASPYGAHIVDSKLVKEKGEDWLSQGNASGTGAYKLRKWTKGGDYILEKHPEYWRGWEGKHFDMVVFKPVPDHTTRRQMVESGQADYVNELPPNMIESLKNNPNVQVITGPSWTSLMAQFNTRRPPLDNKLVRQALAYAVPFDDIINTVMNGYATQSKSLIPPGLFGHLADLPTYTHDLDKAKELLTRAGYPNGGFKLVYTIPGEGGQIQQVAELWKASLAKIGVDLEIKPMNWEQQWELAKSADESARQDIISYRWWPGYPDPYDNFVNLVATQEQPFFNLSYYSNPTVDQLMEEARIQAATDPQGALAKYRQLQEILYEDVPHIFFFDNLAVRITARNFKGFKDNPAYTGVVFFYNTYREG